MKQVLLISLLFLVACGQKAVVKNSGPEIVSYGDSITFGAYGDSYIKQVAQYNNSKLINKAISGTHMDSPNQCSQLMTDTWDAGSIVVFMPGANDALIYGNDAIHINYYEDCLTRIVARISAIPVKLVIATPVQTLPNEYFTNDTLKIYSDINTKVANDYGVQLVDFFNTYVPNSQLDYDFEHPNTKGYQVMAKIFISLITM